jgi:alpha-glucosidase
VVEYTDEAPINPLTFEVYPPDTSQSKSERDYYEDDGISFDYQRAVYLRQHLRVSEENGNIAISVSTPSGSYHPPARSLVFKVHGQRRSPRRIEIDGQTSERVPSPDSLSQAAGGWAYDENANVVWIKVPDRGAALAARIEFRAD